MYAQQQYRSMHQLNNIFHISTLVTEPTMKLSRAHKSRFAFSFGVRQRYRAVSFCRTPSDRRAIQFLWRSCYAPRTRIDLVHPYRRAKWHYQCQAISSLVFAPPLVFFGLFLSLWAYKCIALIIFQSKIIYMPSIPPFSRREIIHDYAKSCSPIVWHEHMIRTADGVQLTLAMGSESRPCIASKNKHVLIAYFQGYVLQAYIWPLKLSQEQ